MEWFEIQQLIWTVVGVIIVLVGLAGVTFRFLLKPFITEFIELRAGSRTNTDTDTQLRLERMEEQLEALGSSVKRLAEAAEFDRQLGFGESKPQG